MTPALYRTAAALYERIAAADPEMPTWADLSFEQQTRLLNMTLETVRDAVAQQEGE